MHNFFIPILFLIIKIIEISINNAKQMNNSMGKSKKLLAVSFWYKDHGFLVTKDADSIITTCEDHFAKFPPEHYDDLLIHLETVINNFDKRSLMELSFFGLYVYALTKVGKIPNDQFNGMQYIYDESKVRHY